MKLINRERGGFQNPEVCGQTFLLLILLPFSVSSLPLPKFLTTDSCLPRPQFSRGQKAKNASKVQKITKTLATPAKLVIDPTGHGPTRL